MVQDLFKWQDIDLQLGQAFSPATAISRKDFFHGRRTAMRRIMDAVNQAGQHVAIYGERGVGKTSVANVLASFLSPFTSEQIVSHKVNCFRETTFANIWNAFFKILEEPEKPSYEALTPSDVLHALGREKRKLILIVDEFDRIENPDVDAMFADTIKTLSDFEIDTTLVIVGVADDVDDLIAEHESIDRCLLQSHLPRMQPDELREIVEYGIKSVDMSISQDASTRISTLSMGLPRYAHSLGLGAGRAAIDDYRISVELGDVGVAVRGLLQDTQQTMHKQFATATYTPRKENSYFHVLLACALAPTDHTGCFRAADIREPYAMIKKRRYEIPAFSRQLHDLCSDVRGQVLQKIGEAHRFRFRFTDPMMQPFILMHGLERNLVGLEAIRPTNV